MKITTWNVNGIRAREGDLTEWVLREKPDVLCLQEIKASLDQIPSALHGLDGYWRYWHGGSGGYRELTYRYRRESADVVDGRYPREQLCGDVRLQGCGPCDVERIDA